ncbi:hypothetical protein V495_04007 [Pseudogymnoascus sp. VKM F-4514 (FW-929)]|nr:hypothetical protein V495_04007 [Pseudogymnoascus sp. VKM F-4514 (FW-929)]KFY54312.1 hypothetical protein V497_07805 [Pseudogymnoascus sp. VKM F-4516 (FW-969)]
MGNAMCANATCANTTALLAAAYANQNVVKWQSALWALLALAINAMTQPSIADPSPNSAISLARSSPGICFIDAISTLTWVAVGRLYGESVSNSLAAKQIATHHDLATPRTSTFSPAVSAVFFVLGPLPQAIKLAGMSNVYTTNLLGFIFFISYLIGVWESEAIRRATRHHAGQSWLSFAVRAPRIPVHVRDRLAWLSESVCSAMIVFNCGVWIGIAHAIVTTSKDPGKLSIMRIKQSAILLACYEVAVMFIALPAGLLGKWYLGKWLQGRFSERVGPRRMRPALHAGLLYGPAAFSSFSALALMIFLIKLLQNSFSSEKEVHLGWKTYADTKESLVGLSWALLVLFVLAISVPLLTVGLFMANSVLEPRKPEELNENNTYAFLYKVLLPGFAACNLIFMVLSYAYIYDDMWTSKPGWSEMLG